MLVVSFATICVTHSSAVFQSLSAVSLIAIPLPYCMRIFTDSRLNMPLRDHFKKKDKQADAEPEAPIATAEPEFKIFRSDTHGSELIASSQHTNSIDTNDGAAESKHRSIFRRDRSVSNVSAKSVASNSSDRPSATKRLSQRFNLRRDEQTSESVPANLPDIPLDKGGEGQESQWEKRATILARKNEESVSRPTTPSRPGSSAEVERLGQLRLGEHHERESSVSSKRGDDNIQEAIRLHEAGDLVTATKMFGRLADPNGENNALSQVLYGLALRFVLFATRYHYIAVLT